MESSADAEYTERLRRDVEEWQKEGLVRPDQAQLILARYGLVEGETPGTLHRSRLVYILAVLGVILVGTGVVLLIGSNWEAIPKWARIALLILATLASYLGGFRMVFRTRTYPKVGMALLLLGSILWGASIFLIGQMYSLGGEGGEVDATFYWFVGVLPLAYILASSAHLALSLAIGSTWLALAISRAAPYEERLSFLLFLALGVLLYAVGRLHANRETLSRFDLVYRWFGLVYVMTALYAFSFRGFWSYTLYRAQIRSTLEIVVPVMVAGAIALVVLLATQARRDRVTLHESVGLFFLIVLCGGALAYLAFWLPEVVRPHEYHYVRVPLVAMGLFNLLLLAAEVAVIALGWFRNHPGLASFGIFVFFVQVLTRYFDLLGGMLSGGLMFIGAGLLLIFGGLVLERSRRRLLAAMAQRRTA
jgi:uncharacterized membrane protein